jgi:hypothetical protein
VDVEAARDENDSSGSAQLASLRNALPDNRRNCARTVTQRQPEKLAAISPRARLGLTDQERLGNVASFKKFPHLHRFAKIECFADGTDGIYRDSHRRHGRAGGSGRVASAR